MRVKCIAQCLVQTQCAFAVLRENRAHPKMRDLAAKERGEGESKEREERKGKEREECPDFFHGPAPASASYWLNPLAKDSGKCSLQVKGGP